MSILLEPYPNIIGTVIAILGVIVIPLIIWGVTVERRLEKVSYNHEEIKNMKNDIKANQETNQKNFDKVISHLQSIELQLKDKQDKK